jgi:hypothetical protein
LGVAKELKMTLSRLLEEMTREELLIWSAYFGYLNQEQEKKIEEMRRQQARGRR